MKPILGATLVVLCLSTVGFGATSFDLNDGSFVTLSPYTGVYQSPLFDIADVIIGVGGTATFDFEFVSSGGLRQFILLTETAPVTLPNEGVIFDVFGTGTSLVNPFVTLTNATGSYRGFADPPTTVTDADVISYIAIAPEEFADGIRIGEFSDSFPNDPSLATGFPRDVTNESLRFFDLHLELFNVGPDEITVTSLSFQAIANSVQVATVPEPATFTVWSLLGSLGAAIGWRRRRHSA